MATNSVGPVKIEFKGEIRTFKMDLGIGIDALVDRFCEAFKLERGKFTIQYTDPAGDVVTVSNQDEYEMAWRSFRVDRGEVVYFKARDTNDLFATVAEHAANALHSVTSTLKCAGESAGAAFTDVAMTMAQLERARHSRVAVVVVNQQQKWAAQLATIRDIFPDVDTAIVIERLEAANGDVEVVLNALMEAM